MRKLIGITLALGLVAAACTTETSPDPTTGPGGTDGRIVAAAQRFDPSEVRFVATLERFDACDAVLDHFIAEALARVGPYGLEGGGYPYPVARGFEETADFVAADGAAAPTTTIAASRLQAGAGDSVAFSGTNVQVAGVDEPDIVKTDGSRIVAVVNGRLTVVDVTGDRPELLGSLFLSDSWNHRLFVEGDTAIVFANGGGGVFPVEPGVLEDRAAESILPPDYYGPVTTITQIDLSDPADLQIERVLRVEGNFLSARSIDGTARVVISSFPSDLPFVYPSGPAAEKVAEEANRKIVAESTLETWLPSYVLTDADGDVLDEGLAPACERMHRPSEFAGFETLTVLTLDLDGELTPGDGTAVIARGETVYASTQNLYVATNVWVPETLIGDARLRPVEENYETAIHMFSIEGDTPAEYLASGSVKGHLLNQFSLDEYDGHLRVATTEGPPWGFDDRSESFVRVLTRDGDRLTEVGSVGDMGKGERIFSVRFVEDTAYVVTFRQTDPFYVVDLRNPARPEVAGELKIPGYSAYLHPLGDGKILGVGQDADPDGRVLGAKASLFDVSDPANPRELDVWSLGSGNTGVEWDHQAFLYWAPDGAAVLPIQDWQNSFFGAVVLDVTDRLDERGRITHDERPAGTASDCNPVDDDRLQEWTRQEGMIVQVCGSQDRGGWPDKTCEVISGEDLKYAAEEFIVGGIELGDDQRLEICWPEYYGGDPILRSIVIGDTLWTLTSRSLQSNDLATLETIGQISIG